MTHLEQIKALDTPRGHYDFLCAQWRTFAAYAWSRYLEEGRGAIVLDLRNAAKAGSGIHLPTFYVAEGSDKLARRGGWPSADVEQAIHDYFPEEEIVFIVLRLDGDVFHYVGAADPAPPDAYGVK